MSLLRTCRVPALVIAAVLVTGCGSNAGPDEPAPPVARTASVPPGVPGFPPLPADATPNRLLPPVPVTTSGSYAFEHSTADGRPLTYDPCRPIHYVVNPAGMPKRGLDMVREAVAEISAATGLVFRDDGLTDEPLADDRKAVQPQRYGNVWAPVLIGWTDKTTAPSLGGRAGVGGSFRTAPSGPDSYRYTTGKILLSRAYFAGWESHYRGYETVRGVVMHELGHVVGLDHVKDKAELMDPASASTTDRLGPGDRQGLALVGAGPCRRDT